jgi:hypothetical protein
MNGNVLMLLALLLATGCATRPISGSTPWQRPAGLFPADGLVTQRVVLGIRGRQFALNGYAALDSSRGRRLVVTEGFGQVLGDVLIKPDGKVVVMQSSRMLRPKWIQRYVAVDFDCLFGQVPAVDCPVQMTGSNHFVLQRRWYKLDFQVVAVQPGPQPAGLFDETRAKP